MPAETTTVPTDTIEYPLHTPSNGSTIEAQILILLALLASLIFVSWYLWRRDFCPYRREQAHQRQERRMRDEEAEIPMKTLRSQQVADNRSGLGLSPEAVPEIAPDQAADEERGIPVETSRSRAKEDTEE
jgi:hypothetical protein